MTTQGTALQKKPDAEIETQASKQLMEGYAGFVNDDASSAQERIVRLAGLVPVALQVQEEARSTVERLRDENEKLGGEDFVTGSNWETKITEVRERTLRELLRQWNAIRQRGDWNQFVITVSESFGDEFMDVFIGYAHSFGDPIPAEDEAS